MAFDSLGRRRGVAKGPENWLGLSGRGGMWGGEKVSVGKGKRIA